MPKLDKIAKKKKSFCLSGTILFVNKKKQTNKKQSIAKFVLFHPKIISLNPLSMAEELGKTWRLKYSNNSERN